MQNRRKHNKIPSDYDEFLQLQKQMERKGEFGKESLEREVAIGRGREGRMGGLQRLKHL